MMSAFGHPRALTLSRYVDGDLSSKARRRTEEHLGRCPKCRETVDFIRELGEAAREQSGAGVPDVADEVIRRGAQGERVVLETPRRNRALGPGTLQAVAAIVLLVLGGAALILTLAPSASASRSELTFDPDEPTPGELIQVEYSPAFYLSDYDSLRLRARARKAVSPFPRGGVIGELRLATLHRNPNGTFSGRIRLERDDEFLAAAVEDFEAQNVDTNFGQLWELLVRTDDGSPSVAALEGRYRTLEPYNWILASAWAEEVTERWPDSPFGWALLYFHISRTRTEPLPDSVMTFHRAKLAALVEAQEAGDEEPDDLAWLATYARFLGDTRLQDQLLDRLAELDPNRREVIDRHVEGVFSEPGQDPRVLLNLLEGIWATSDRSNELLVRVALGTAVSVKDVNAARIWLTRAREVEGITTPQLLNITEPLVKLAPLRAEILRAELASLESATGVMRPLRSTREEYEGDLRSASLQTRVALASTLVDAGELAAATAVADDVLAMVWKPQDVQPVVNLFLAANDTTTAIRLIGMLVADPIEGPDALQAYGPVLTAAGVDSAALLETASDELTVRVLSSLSSTRYLPDGIAVSFSDGTEMTAGDYFRGRPTVLLMWRTDVGRAVETLDNFEALAAEPWVADRIRTTVISAPPEAANLEELKRRASPVILDGGYELTESLRAFGAPTYVVLDSDRRIVATVREASTAFRIAHHLAADS